MKNDDILLLPGEWFDTVITSLVIFQSHDKRWDSPYISFLSTKIPNDAYAGQLMRITDCQWNNLRGVQQIGCLFLFSLSTKIAVTMFNVTLIVIPTLHLYVYVHVCIIYICMCRCMTYPCSVVEQV